MNVSYSLVANLEGKLCTVVGGGQVAQRKIASLIEAKARVRVVSPEVTSEILKWSQGNLVEWQDKPYAEGDIEHALLVFAATDKPEVNEQIYKDTDAARQFINVADRPELSSFTVPSVVRRGKLLLSVSTSGASPSAARQIKQQLGRVYGAEYAIYLDFLSDFRALVMNQVEDDEIRQTLLRHAVEWPILDWIREGSMDDRASRIFQQLLEHPEELVHSSGSE